MSDMSVHTVPLDHDLVGSGPPVVLVHGITESRRSWDPIVERLTADRSVLAVDVRGHGASPKADSYDAISMASDIRALVDELGLDEPMVLGHSMGGLVATAYAALAPTVAVVNVDQPLDLVGFQAQVQEVEPLLRSDAFGDVITGLFASMRGPLSAEESERVEALRAPDRDVVLGVWAPLLELEVADLRAMVDQVVGGIDVPYLSLHGIDPGEGYDAWLQERIPTATVERWDGTGHYPHLVDPDRFIDRVRALDPR
jgi:pimeloyl-ACP methyl ester carboxylesterase